MHCVLRTTAALLMCLTCFCGCNGGTSAELTGTRVHAQKSYSDGAEAFANRNYVAAEDNLAAAYESGGLNLDMLCDAGVKLAVCRSASGRFDEAHQLLDSLEHGAPNMDEVYAARSYILRKQGKRTEALAAWNDARQLNRGVPEFRD